jgi:biotin carboxylase
MAERYAILCIANNYGPPRTAHALTRNGAQVCIVAPPASYAALTRFKHADLLLPAQEIQAKLPGVMTILADEFGADHLFAGDDLAFAALTRLVERLPGLQLSDKARALLARSLPPAKAGAVLSRDCEIVMARAQSACPPPPSIANPSEADALRFAKQVGFPVLLKRDGFSSGRGISMCGTPDALKQAYTAATNAPSAFGRGLVVQKLLSGTVYGVSVSGIAGRRLAGFSFIKHVVDPKPFGPTSVAKPLRREDILADATQIYEFFGLSGFAGFDYLVDDNGKAHFLEINPRIMPTTHLGERFGADLVGAFMAHARGQAPPADAPASHDYIALYPNERLRDHTSRYLEAGFHDEPLDDPDVHAAMLAGKGRS